MAQRVLTLLTCDLHEEETEATETINFSVNGTSYEIDACKEHDEEFQETFAIFIGHARKVGRNAAPAKSPKGSSKRSSSNGGAPADLDLNMVREWARQNTELKVAERGRVSAQVLEAYRAAH